MHKDVRQAKGIGFGEVGRCSDVRVELLSCKWPQAAEAKRLGNVRHVVFERCCSCGRPTTEAPVACCFVRESH